jgi:mRNA interferase RelE/StbE
MTRIELSKQYRLFLKIQDHINVKKLSGREAWRIRVGKYRIIYEIDDGKLTILVILVGHRKEVYRK